MEAAMRISVCLLAVAALLIVGAGVRSTFAYDTIYWTQPAGGEFLDPINWSRYPPTYPGNIAPESVTAGCLRFDQGQSSPYTVTLSRNASVGEVRVDNDRVSLDLQGHRLITSSSGDWPFSLYIGVREGANGEMTLTNGTLSTEDAHIGASWPNCSGTLRVDGGTLELRNYAELLVGAGDAENSPEFTSQGNLIIRNGGKVLDVGTSDYDSRGIWVGGDHWTGDHGAGHITVDGSGSTLYTRGSIYLGTNYGGKGYLTVSDGGLVQANGSIYIGDAWDSDYYASHDNSLGDATVTGINSRLVATNVFVGHSAHGTLSVFDGGQLSSKIGLIGSDKGSAGVAYVDGAGSTWTNSDDLHVGSSGNGKLMITNHGAVSSRNGYAGDNVNSTGEITVSGAGSTWTNGDSLYIGYRGGGTLSINDGGAVSNGFSRIGNCAGSTGTVTVSGTGSTWNNTYDLSVGESGNGKLSITGGGNVSNDYSYIGNYSNSTGEVTVSGAGSTWNTANDLSVGDSGHGKLLITNGGAVGSRNGYAGYYANSTGEITVSGAGSTWTNGDGFYIGYHGGGTLSIDHGGSVSNSGYSYIGNYSGSTGTVTVDGAGSTWNNTYDLSVGCNGNGKLSITNGGSVSNSTYGFIGRNSGSTGAVMVDGASSTWTNNSYLYVGNDGSGTLSITNGGKVSVAEATIVALGEDATGLIDFGAGGGTLNTRALFASPTQLKGTGTINTCGLVSDIDLIFGSNDALKQTITLNQSGQNVKVDLDMTGGTGVNGSLGAGFLGIGSLTIKNGVAVNSDIGRLGYHSDSVGVVTVSGTGSTWNNNNDTFGVFVGFRGVGKLSITDGGKVSGQNTYLGEEQGSTGVITVDGIGSTLAGKGALYVGVSGNGTLKITGGGTVSDVNGIICLDSGSTGAATVDGIGSTWINSGYFQVGRSGSGTLSITNGGAVKSTGNAYSGRFSGSKGLVTVDGIGSTWTTAGNLFIGSEGSGTLRITNGGSVTASGTVSINSASLMAIDIGRGSSLTANAIVNNGVVYMTVGAGVVSGIYSPITAATWDSTGSWQAIGGKWINHQFIVSDAATGSSGSSVKIDLASTQRVSVTDPLTGNSLVANFLATTGSASFTATAITDETILNALKTTADVDESFLSGWLFSTDGYTVSPTNPVYLSLLVGSGYSLDNLALWHYDDDTLAWSKYITTDLSYDGTYANFTVTGFSGYALIAVPEPGALVLLAAGLLGLLAYAWRKQK
jgi:T5SS/PEP-CTERM-associated repeat protein